MGKQHSAAITFEERLKIEEHIKNGLSCSKTAKLIGRSKNGVVVEVRRGGGKFYTAKVGQFVVDQNLEEKYKKISKANKVLCKDIYPNIKKRLQNLEFQIEILHQTIKELLK